MLHVTTVSDPRARYYLDDLGDELARLTPAHAGLGGRWTGTSATALGLAGPVDADELGRLLEARHPATGRPLLSRPRRVVAYDLTFSAPKSVSVLAGLGTPEARAQVLEAHAAAVTSAVAYLERRAATVRRGSGDERAVCGADGLAAAGFTHWLSRAGDPHLHTHVVAANLGHGEDGRWSALDGRGLFAHARAAGALYGAALRAGIAPSAGGSWRWHDRGGWELGGADPALLAAFSGRAAEIREEAARRGGGSPGSRRIAWAATRGPKDRRSAAELSADWATRARIGGLALGRDTVERDTERLDEHRFAAELSAGPPSGVTRRDVVAAWGTAAVAGAPGREIDAAVDHWVPSAAGRGVAEPRLAPAECVPAPHLLRALGPRPVVSDGQTVWRGAAAALDGYRARWGVTGPEPLGAREHLAAFPTARLAERVEVARRVREARLELGGPALPVLAREGVALER